MKKNIFSILSLMLLLFAASSCEKDEVGGTATEATAGDWYCTMAAVDENGESVDDDWFGLGFHHVITFNTAANVATEMWLSDEGVNEDYFPYKLKINVNPEAGTFQAEAAANEFDENKVTVYGGKVVKNGTKTPSGIPADYIEFFISFDNDEFPSAYGFKCYKVTGYRYSGFVADE